MRTTKVSRESNEKPRMTKDEQRKWKKTKERKINRGEVTRTTKDEQQATR